jgi:large subunit ribosomal protein L4
MRRAAIRSALSQKAADQQIVVVDSLDMTVPKTREFAAAMKALGITKGLVVLPGRNQNVEKSANNVSGVKTLFASYLNIRDIFTYDQLVMPLDSLDAIKDWLGK